MKEKRSARTRQRSSSTTLPSKSQIARERHAIQSTWSTREKQRRHTGKKQSQQDSRFQAHVRFIKFLMELETSQR